MLDVVVYCVVAYIVYIYRLMPSLLCNFEKSIIVLVYYRPITLCMTHAANRLFQRVV